MLLQHAKPLPPITGGNSNAIIIWATDVVQQYQELRIKNSALIAIVKVMQTEEEV